MAEAFGIAAGAIGVVSLSIQLAESLQKVRGFYAAAKDAPPQIEEIIEEIEIMQEILSDLESSTQSASIASSTNMQRCMKVAERATKSFAAFSSELQSRVKKSRFRGSVKFALSREDIRQMLDQLERTKSSLNLVYNLYQQATAEYRHAALVSAVLSSQGVAAENAQNTIAITRKISQMSQRSVFGDKRLFLISKISQMSQRSVFGDKRLFLITTPEWISNTVWQFEMRRSITGLNVMLRTYGVVPWNAPVLDACRKGDTIEMQRLFDNRLASPLDRDVYGCTLWQRATLSSQANSLRFLSRFVAMSGFAHSSDLTHSLVFHSCAHFSDKIPRAGVGRQLREDLIWLHEHCDDDFDNGYPELREPVFHTRAMRLMLCSPDDADSVWFWQCLEIPVMRCKIICSKKAIKNMLARYLPLHHGSKTPLQLAAVATTFCAPMCPSQEWDFEIRGLERIIAVIIATGAQVHEGDHHHTPLLLFLTAICARARWDDAGPSLRARPRDIQRGLQKWLKILQHNGVDLVAYGAEERRRFLAYRSLENPTSPLIYWYNLNGPIFRPEVHHFSFSYGPMPEDWTIQLDDMSDQYVGDFWQMPGLLDESVPTVPGAWVDDSSA